ATLTLQSKPVQIENGASVSLPSMPQPELPGTRLPDVTSVSLPLPAPANSPQTNAGRYTKSFSYSGPTMAVHIEENVRSRKTVYLDHTCCFEELPHELEGADWVQA